MMPLTLTADQQAAQEAFYKFLVDPIETVFVLEGYAGCGKSTLVTYLIERVDGVLCAASLIDKTLPDYEIVLTATTNKAAEALAGITKRPVKTIHSYLSLRVKNDYASGNSTLVPATADKKYNALIFIDEASMADSHLLKLIFSTTQNCKIVFIGDRAQLLQVKASAAPVFEAKFTGAKLEQVVRQVAGNPIIDLATKFRETVKTGQFFSFKPDGNAIKHLSREEFNQEIIKEFTRKDWHFSDSKILAWTNKKVIQYNQALTNLVQGTPELQIGDYAICNSYVRASSGLPIKTDQMVYITGVEDNVIRAGVMGKNYTMDYSSSLVSFMPNDEADRKSRLKQAKAENDYSTIAEIEESWIDLRAAFACTINKSQGSTFDRVYIDLDDIRRCNSGDQIARMMYVACSRARHQVILVGDLGG